MNKQKVHDIVEEFLQQMVDRNFSIQEAEHAGIIMRREVSNHVSPPMPFQPRKLKEGEFYCI